jgi:hypothetical protein
VNDLLKLAVEGLDPTVVTRGHLSITSKWIPRMDGECDPRITATIQNAGGNRVRTPSKGLRAHVTLSFICRAIRANLSTTRGRHHVKHPVKSSDCAR